MPAHITWIHQINNYRPEPDPGPDYNDYVGNVRFIIYHNILARSIVSVH